MANEKDRRGLGRGLSALLQDVDMGEATPTARASADNIPVEMIFPNKNQPRRQFPEENLRELADSIAEKGVIQPLIVRKLAENEYQIVAGERRWRAAQIAKLHMVPCVVRNYTDVEVQEIAIIENIQRQDLNVIDEAEAYRALVDTYGHTQEQLSKVLGKSRSHIANLLRLIDLPGEVREMVQDGTLTMGHARAILTANKPVLLARRVVSKGLSVRETESLAKLPWDEVGKSKAKTAKVEKDADTRLLEQELSANLGLKVEIDHKADGSGVVKVSYTTLEDLDQICGLLSSS